jgi:parallel beta-helix repeat protein
MNNVMRTVNCKHLFLTLSVVAAFALFSAPAQAKPPETVSCGQTLTHSVKLANDLSDCPSNGLVVGADDVTVDLNGHTIDGDGEQVADCPGFPGPDCDVGVQNTGGYTGVTIEGGKLREFAWGVEVFGGASHNRVRHISSTHNLFRGILVGGGITDSQVESNSATDNGAGIVLCCSSSNVRIEWNSVSGNGDGIVVRGSDNNRIANNSVSDNTDIGEGSEGFGIAIEGNDNEVSHNRLHGNADNIGLFGDRNRVTANEVTDPVSCPDQAEHPGDLTCGHGIQLGGGEGNLVANNRVLRALSNNISVDSFDPDFPTVGTVVRDNYVRDAGVDDIGVGTDVNGIPAAVTDTLILRNTATGAGDDGIDVDSTETTLTRNGAYRNDDLGIEAVPGVTDGGGNRAAGNGNPLQCTNVFCR